MKKPHSVYLICSAFGLVALTGCGGTHRTVTATCNLPQRNLIYAPYSELSGQDYLREEWPISDAGYVIEETTVLYEEIRDDVGRRRDHDNGYRRRVDSQRIIRQHK